MLVVTTPGSALQAINHSRRREKPHRPLLRSRWEMGDMMRFDLEKIPVVIGRTGPLGEEATV